MLAQANFHTYLTNQNLTVLHNHTHKLKCKYPRFVYNEFRQLELKLTKSHKKVLHYLKCLASYGYWENEKIDFKSDYEPDSCWPTNVQIAKQACVCLSTVKRSLDFLVKTNLIRRSTYLCVTKDGELTRRRRIYITDQSDDYKVYDFELTPIPVTPVASKTACVQQNEPILLEHILEYIKEEYKELEYIENYKVEYKKLLILTVLNHIYRKRLYYQNKASPAT